MLDGRFGESQLAFLKEIGFDLVELSFNCPPMDYQNVRQCEGFRKTAERLGMSYTAHAPDTIKLSSPDRDEVQTGIEICKDVIESTQICGADTLVVHACSYIKLQPGKEHLQKANLLWALESVAGCCERWNVKLAVETMCPGWLTSDIDLLIDVVDSINSPQIGICIDTNHLNLSVGLGESIKKAGSRILEFHVNDNHLLKEEHLLPFDGLIDWQEFVHVVCDLGFSGKMIMEPSWPAGADVHKMIRRAKCASEKIISLFGHAKDQG